MPSTHSILGGLRFQEVGYDPTGTPGFDTNGSGAANSSDEYIAITNTSSTAIDLHNVEIWQSEAIHVFPPGSTIAAGETIYIVPSTSLANVQAAHPSEVIIGANSGSTFNLQLNNDDAVLGMVDSNGNYTELAWGAGGAMSANLSFPGTHLLGRDSVGDIADGQTLQYNGLGNLIAANATLCFAAGSMIMTDRGEVAVETLQTGDLVATADGTHAAVKWMGRQTINKLFRGPHMQPVRIRTGALGDGLPHSDLTVTADHGMVFPSSSEAVGETKNDGYVINASALVNGDSIDWVPIDELEDSVIYYHIELEAHDVILANGAASETFVDAVTRSHFDNHQEYLDLYGVERIIPEMDRPRISSRRLVPQAIKARLGSAAKTSQAA